MKKIIVSLALTLAVAFTATADSAKKKAPLKVGDKAPTFQIKDTNGKQIDLNKLTKKGPVLVRLTCGCLGCDRELPYFQAVHEAYKKQGIQFLAVFAEPDEKFAKYVKSKKLNMLYATDPKKQSWPVFGTKTMPSNFLIDKGGKVIAVSKGCDPSGLIATKIGNQAATLVKADKVNIKQQVDKNKKPATPKK
jgi:peroxiredoxin|tara:strand:+ start:387 stop:962 length:576 start_codon:yes stop_codon:yes gene_type:complete